MVHYALQCIGRNTSADHHHMTVVLHGTALGVGTSSGDNGGGIVERLRGEKHFTPPQLCVSTK